MSVPRPKGGGSDLSDPFVIYIRSDGNDGTGEIGNPGKPFLTGTAAYNAGVASNQRFVMKFGVGTFDIGLSSDFNSRCKDVEGSGFSVNEGQSATVIRITSMFHLNGEDVPSTPNTYGLPAPNVNGTSLFSNAFFKFQLVGQSGTMDDEYPDPIEGGQGGSIDINAANCALTFDCQGGGVFGPGNAGAWGYASVRGAGWFIGQAGFGIAEEIVFDGGDVRFASFVSANSGTIKYARVSYNDGVNAPSQDYGGCGVYTA